MLRTVFIIFVGVFASIFSSFTETLGDRILQNREAQLNAMKDDLSPFKERKITSALANVASIDGSIKLLDPKEGLLSFTLLDAIKRALEKSYTLRNGELKLKNATDDSKIVNNFQNLNVDLKMGLGKAGNFGDDSRDDFHRHLYDLSNLEDSFHIGLNFEYPLIDGGKSSGEIELSKVQKELINLDVIESKQNLLKKITDLFIQMILLQEKLEIASMSVEMARYKLASEENKPASDPQMPVNLLSLKLVLEKELQSEFTLRNELRHNQSNFRNLLGLDEKANFGIDKDAKTRTIQDSLTALITLAEKNAIPLQKIRLRQAGQTHAYRVIKSQQLPFVDLYAKTNYARLADRSDLHEMRFNFGLKFDMNLFDGKKTSTKMQINERLKSIHENDYNKTLVSMRSEITRYFNQFVDLRARISITQNNLKLARSIMYESEDRFQKRQINKYQLLGSRLTFKQSLLQYYEIMGNLIQTKINLFALTGQLNENVFG